jgi:hypothetical protein
MKPLQCTRTLLLCAMMIVSCGGKNGDSAADPDENSSDSDGDPGISLPDDDNEDEPDDGGCDTLALDINGESAEDIGDPTVGDEWVVFLVCDGANLHGANILAFAPAELASVENFNTIATFLAAGTGTMTMQSGSHRLTIPITVLDSTK